MTLDWHKVTAFALALPDTELSTSYGKPAIKTVSNGRAFLHGSREEGSFVLAIDQDTKEMLIETDPETFWQTPHYHGWPGLLVRYDSADPERVVAMIERSRDWSASRPRPKPRKKA
ncbi:MAG: MmcQ/YjbR family DNA-binding protein [Sphingomonas sp.]